MHTRCLRVVSRLTPRAREVELDLKDQDITKGGGRINRIPKGRFLWLNLRSWLYQSNNFHPPLCQSGSSQKKETTSYFKRYNLI